MGRRADALAPAEEAVQLYRDLAGNNPAFLPDLAGTLNNLGNRYSEAGSPERGEAAWEQTITEAAPQAAAFLLVDRAAAADAGHPAAAAWLSPRSLWIPRIAVTAPFMSRRVVTGPDPAAFDEDSAQLHRHTGPAWLTVDPELLDSVRAWEGTGTYTGERDYLAAHPELLLSPPPTGGRRGPADRERGRGRPVHGAAAGGARAGLRRLTGRCC